jgi:hypothetical protein
MAMLNPERRNISTPFGMMNGFAKAVEQYLLNGLAS